MLADPPHCARPADALVRPDHRSKSRPSCRQDGLVTLAPRLNGCRWRRGDRLRIVAGAFEGHSALFEGEMAHERIRVLLDFMGATRPIDLPVSDAERPRRSRNPFTRPWRPEELDRG